MSTRSSGQHYEDIACMRLQAAGLRLVERNASSRHGEIDLIMRDGETLVSVEVYSLKCAIAAARVPATDWIRSVRTNASS